MEKGTYVWKFKLPSTMIYTESVSFLTSTNDRISQKYCRCQWLSLDKSIGEFSIVYKKMRALLWLRVYNHDFGL